MLLYPPQPEQQLLLLQLLLSLLIDNSSLKLEILRIKSFRDRCESECEVRPERAVVACDLGEIP